MLEQDVAVTVQCSQVTMSLLCASLQVHSQGRGRSRLKRMKAKRSPGTRCVCHEWNLSCIFICTTMPLFVGADVVAVGSFRLWRTFEKKPK